MTIDKNNEYGLKNLRILPYIGKKRAKKLRDAGLDTIDKIAKSSPEDLKKILGGLTDSQLEEIIKMAKEVALSAGIEIPSVTEEKIEEKTEEVKAKAEEEISEKPEEEVEVGGEEVKEAVEVREKEEIDEEDKEKIELAKWLFGGEYTEFIKEKHKKREEKEEEVVSEEEEKEEIREEKKREEKVEKRYRLKVRGLVNGYINGYSGVVNGNGVVYGLQKTSRTTLGWLIPLLIAIFIVLPVFLLSVHGSAYISIDGNFDDWINEKYYGFGIFGMRSTSVDSTTYLYFQIDNMFSDYSSLLVFLDDGKGDFKVTDDFSASYVIRVDGYNGKTYTQGFYRIYGNMSMDKAKIMRLAFRGNEMEISISRKIIRYCAFYIDFDNKVSYSTPIITVGKGYAYFEIITMNMRCINGEKKFAELNYRIDGISNCTLSLSVSPASAVETWYALRKEQRIDFGYASSTISIPSGEGTYDIYVRIRNDAVPSQILRISASVQSTDIVPTIVDKTSGIYILSPPEHIKIDGAFGDWGVIIGDGDDGFLDKSADISGYSYAGEGSKSFYYLRFFSQALLGNPIAISPVDSDRDTVPDYIDPMPDDFNNDGVSDSTTDHDVDGDGVKDYPYGNDMWLNTTLPSNFPDDYAGKKVSIHLGAKAEKRNGEEKITIYIDSDGLSTTGLRYEDIGADYRIVIRGKYGDVMEARVERWESGWFYLSEAAVATGYSEIELSANFGVGNDSRIIIEAQGWTGERDSISKILFKGPQQPHVIYGYVYDENGNPLANAPVVITNAATGDNVTVYTDSNGFYQYNLANLPNGCSDGDLIYVNATNTSSGNKGSNSTYVDTTTPSQQVDVYIKEINFFVLAVPLVITAPIVLRRK